MTSDDVIISGVDSIVLRRCCPYKVGERVMTALVLKWLETNRGRVRTCAPAVIMADLKYYSFKF